MVALIVTKLKDRWVVQVRADHVILLSNECESDETLDQLVTESLKYLKQISQ